MTAVAAPGGASTMAAAGGAQPPGASVYMGAAGAPPAGATSAYISAPGGAGGGGVKSVAIGGPGGPSNLPAGQSGYFAVSKVGGVQSTYIK
ncbi:hypothetical protein OSTOST_06094 [Ostertagia ostertagi]